MPDSLQTTPKISSPPINTMTTPFSPTRSDSEDFSFVNIYTPTSPDFSFDKASSKQIINTAQSPVTKTPVIQSRISKLYAKGQNNQDLSTTVSTSKNEKQESQHQNKFDYFELSTIYDGNSPSSTSSTSKSNLPHNSLSFLYDNPQKSKQALVVKHRRGTKKSK